MKERPILFSGPMVRAILEDKKGQTRRIVKPQPPADFLFAGRTYCCTDKREIGKFSWVDQIPAAKKSHHVRCPFEDVTQLWVRETWQSAADMNVCHKADDYTIYRATDPDWQTTEGWAWRPSIYMPRNRSRITLEITNVAVQRLQDISEEDAIAEGVSGESHMLGHEDARIVQWTERLRLKLGDSLARPRYALLWENINGPGSWEQNPWVWVINFRRINPAGAPALADQGEGR